MLEIRPAQIDDIGAIAMLFDEMDGFYGDLPEVPETRRNQIEDALFGSYPAAAHVLLAWHHDELAGLASCTYLWPAVGTTRSIYLKELYVAEAMRRMGIGARLMEEVFFIARKAGCSRVEWTTDSDSDAWRFYESLGAEPTSKVFFRMTQTELTV